jgi:hypothetical protein
MWRNILALITGIVLSIGFNLLLTSVSGVLYPPPAMMDLNDPGAFAKHVASLPPLAIILVLIAHIGGAFAGAVVAARMAVSTPMKWALTVGAIALVGGLLNLVMIQHPVWMWAELPFYLLAAWAGGRLGKRS